jgi:eukaryotic-like serine/threonine-protein kinase
MQALLVPALRIHGASCGGRKSPTVDQPLNVEPADPGKEASKKDGLGDRERRACPTCGTELFGAANYCPVCMLRKALSSEGEPGHSASESAVEPTRELASHCFQHYELVIGDDGKPIELGRGAMGVTYKAFDVDLRVLVTLKLISEKYVGDESARLRFLREARAAAKVRHTNVASVFHLGNSSGDYFYAMEFVEGETLERLVNRSGCLDATLSLEILIQLAAGMAAIDEQHLVHRDIKPTNIIVQIKQGDRVAAKIIDLGLAKTVGESAPESAISVSGGFAGTPEFASPEQFAGVEVDIRSDLYSLGVTVWKMLTGQSPFRGSPAELMYQHQHSTLPLEQVKDVPQPFVSLLEALLEKDPGKRPQSPLELQAQLRKLSVDLQAKDQWTTGSLTGGGAERKRSRWGEGKAGIAIGALLLIAAVASLYWFVTKNALPVVNTKSVAVLPFDNLSDSKENSYFSEGLTSEVIFQLSKVVDLRVISRQSVLRYQEVPIDHQKSLSQIGRELNVAAILESSVQRIDNRVKIITVLYDARINKRIWGASYDREMQDIFAIQSDVAEQIATALQARLSADERASIQQKPTENLVAYDLYLRGWGLYQLYRKEENEKAIDLFKKALEADPKFALAYTGLADAYIERVQRFHGEDFWSDSAIDLGQQAVALDPHEVRGYTELARAFLNRGWPERAREPIRKALELNPNDWRANRFAADELFATGQYDQMYVYLRKCFAVNPNDSYAPSLMAYICWLVGENDLAEKWMQRAIDVEFDPQRRTIMDCERSVFRGDYALAVTGLKQLPVGFYGDAFSASGLSIDCLVHLKDWPALLQLIVDLKQTGDTRKGRDPGTLLMPEAIALRSLGRETEARQTAERCETMARDHLTTKKYDEHWNHWMLAFCARFLGRKEEAYQHMHDSFVNGDVAFLGWLPDGPSLQVFKPDPEFQAILAERDKQNVQKRARILSIEKEYRS